MGKNSSPLRSTLQVFLHPASSWVRSSCPLGPHLPQRRIPRGRRRHHRPSSASCLLAVDLATSADSNCIEPVRSAVSPMVPSLGAVFEELEEAFGDGSSALTAP